MTNRGVIAAITAALCFTGCSVLGSSDDSSDAGSGSDDAAVSPIDDLLGLGGLGDLESGETNDTIVQMLRENDELVASCMANQGFEYIPVNRDDAVTFAGDIDDLVDYGSAEFTERYGFGVTTMYWSQSQVGPSLVGADDRLDDLPAPVDPNEEYLATLSEAEQAAYQDALYGTNPDYEWDTTLSNDENDERARAFYDQLEPSGCYDEALAKGNFANAAAFYDTFADDLLAIDQQVEADPRLIDAKSDIERCVIEQGLDYVDPDFPFQRWSEALADLDAGHMTADGLLDDEGRAELAVLQAEEIAIAVATDECGGSQAELSALDREIRSEYEQRFLDENADRVSAFAADGDS